ncbi:hypothetical protein ZWY2020_039601 [Hordeum vulgare]|nr:hypothetical protein ZWY2020_039601 [Hordeum vulgare]
MANTTTAVGGPRFAVGDAKRRSSTRATSQCCKEAARPRQLGCNTKTCPQSLRCIATSIALQCSLVLSRRSARRRRGSCNGAFVACGGAAMEHSSLAAELQWSIRRPRRSSNGALVAGSAAEMERSSPTEELQRSARCRRRRSNGALAVDRGAAMEHSSSAEKRQWSARRPRRSCNGVLVIRGGAVMERSSPMEELQWIARCRQRSCNGALRCNTHVSHPGVASTTSLPRPAAMLQKRAPMAGGGVLQG